MSGGVEVLSLQRPSGREGPAGTTGTLGGRERWEEMDDMREGFEQWDSGNSSLVQNCHHIELIFN